MSSHFRDEILKTSYPVEEKRVSIRKFGMCYLNIAVPNAGEGVEKREPPCTVGGNVN